MNIKVNISGYVQCHSSFFDVDDVIQEKEFNFSSGISKLVGDIDSGNFAISYLISMYDKINKKTVFLPCDVIVDGKPTSLSELTKKACYIDRSYPLFSKKKTVKRLIESGLKKSKLPYTATEILDIFGVQEHHREISVYKTGTERYKAMCAIGFSYGKEIFCFPWFSKSRYEAFVVHLNYTIKVLSDLNKIVILPLGFND